MTTVLFGLRLVGSADPVDVTRPDLPRVYTELLRVWGPGAIAGELRLHPLDRIDRYGNLYEREVEINPALAQQSPVPSMPLDE